MLELKELKELHDSGYERGLTTRDKASDDLIFYWISQWDDQLLNDSQLSYRGEFNILRKAGRQIMSDIHSNPVQVDFEPVDPDRDDGAEIMDGLYRSSCRNNTSKEAFDNSVNESIVCGVGAWELVNEYETNRVGERNQIIKRMPLYEACNTVIWDPNASLLDKSDADWVSVLVRYSQDGYKKLVEKLTGEDTAVTESNFKSPNESYTFPWIASDKHVWVARFFHREMVKVKSYTLENLFGEQQILTQDQVDEREDQLAEGGFNVVDEREYEVYQVTRYIASGEAILDESIVPGTEIPIVPEYGERAFVEGEETYEGITRLAKDPQRLRNFQLSYLADIVSRSPRNKKIYTAEQLQGHQHMYEESGAENNFPFMIQNRKDANGEVLPLGPVGETGAQEMPIALVQSIELTRSAVDDVANAGLPQNIADPDISGKAVIAMQNRIDMQSFIYQSNHKHAMRRDGEIFASMARVIFDSPRKVALTLPDGTRKQAQIMEEGVSDDMTLTTVNNLADSEFEVFADVGPSFNSQKQQTREELKELINGMPPGDPDRKIFMLKYTELMEGSNFDDVRDYARKQLIMMGVKEPETDEEIAEFEAAQQNQEPDAMQLAAEAEILKGQAEMVKAKASMVQANNDTMSLQLEMAKVQQGGQKVSIEDARARAEIDNKDADTLKKLAEAQEKGEADIDAAVSSELTERLRNVSTADLIGMMG
jgi:hypothetical protein